jgi:hypothetical protein
MSMRREICAIGGGTAVRPGTTLVLRMLLLISP